MGIKKHVILTPKADNKLLRRETTQAFLHLGHMVSAMPSGDISPQVIARLFALPPERSNLPAHPTFFFSVNFHGLDKFGETFTVLKQHGVPVAVWCVDNPWNLLAGIRADFWKNIHLFVTDPSFIPGLRAHGARHVSFLPLAAAGALDTANAHPTLSECAPLQPVVFAGRSAFPDKERFFVGQKTPSDILDAALTLTTQGDRPDFFWWLQQLEAAPEKATLWPAGATRKTSLGAETCSLHWRRVCLESAFPLGLTLFGDAGWTKYFPQNDVSPANLRNQSTPQVDLRPPVDYYTMLPTIYAAATYSLNMTSFLLPHGLNQRHFDVWAANGFCLLDNTPGLAIFPDSLTKPVTFVTPDEIAPRVAHFTKNPKEKNALTAAWREHILAEHTYETRMHMLIKTIFT